MKKTVSQIAYFLLILSIIGLGLWLISLVSQTILYVLLAILILLIMVTIHEFGHYIAGKVLGFKINEFAIGFGTKLFSVKRKNGEIFSIRLFPLGGFCAFEGETEDDIETTTTTESLPFSEYSINDKNTAANANVSYGNRYGHENPASNSVGVIVNKKSDDAAEEGKPKKFNEQPPWKRIIVLLAGGIFNLLSAVIFSFIFILAVGYEQPKIFSVHEIPDNPGQYYNQLLENDVIVAIGGQRISIMKSYNDLLEPIALGESITFTVVRDGKEEDIDLTKQEITYINDDGTTKVFEGFGFIRQQNFARVGIGYAIKYSVPFTGKLAWSILGAFGGLFTGRVGLTELSGPIGTIDTIAEVSAMNWRNIFLLLPLIAANLGLFNLFPIPALDGSKIVFAVIEWIRKKPINRNVEAYIHLAGMVVLLLFVIIIDIISFII